MRGRELFQKSKSLIDLLINLLQLFPSSLLAGGLSWFRHTPGKLGFGIRYLFLKSLAKTCGDVVAIYPGAYFLNVERIAIGHHVSIHQMCYLEGIGGLEIGSHVSLSHSVSIITHEHDYMQTEIPIRDAKIIPKPVIIEDDVWIGAGARILGGVTIGQGTVVGAGAVVTKSIPPGSIAVGVPATVKFSRDHYSVYQRA